MGIKSLHPGMVSHTLVQELFQPGAGYLFRHRDIGANAMGSCNFCRNVTEIIQIDRPRIFFFINANGKWVYNDVKAANKDADNFGITENEIRSAVYPLLVVKLLDWVARLKKLTSEIKDQDFDNDKPGFVRVHSRHIAE